MLRFRFLFTICLFMMIAWSADAQYNSINFDYKTASAMTTEYNAAAASEAYYKSQVQDMLEKYGAVEIAAAGIYSSKHLDRKSLTDLGTWTSETENLYYRRIYNLVSSKIIPELWSLAQMLVRYPHKALYWGGYLVKTTTEVQNLCKQFESIVTNGTLSFSDIRFLEVNPRVSAIIQLSQIGDTDWKSVIDELYNLPSYYTKESLGQDVKQMYSLSTVLASGGYEQLAGRVMEGASMGDDFVDKAQSVCTIVGNVKEIYDEADGNLGNLLNQYWGNNPTAADLFSFSSYNFSSWMTDYSSEGRDSYYTQRYYIACVDQGREYVCDYQPSTEKNNILEGGEWYRIETSNVNFFPSSSQLETILQNSEKYAGWSRATVNSLNAQGNGYTYEFDEYLSSYSITRGGKQTKKAYAYSITVRKSWYFKTEVYEEVFDSYSMDLNLFLLKMNDLVSEYNDNEDGLVYRLYSDSKMYYEVASTAKVQGCETAIITMTCTDNVSLGSGATQYKCKSCGSSLNSHSKECAMKTSITYDDIDDSISQLEDMISVYQHQIDSIKALNETLQQQINDLQRYLNNAQVSEDTRKRYESIISSYKSQIRQNDTKIASLNKKVSEAQQAMAEAKADNEPSSDDYYRIPAIMDEVKGIYKLTWQGEGWWSGYTYYRLATSNGLSGTVTFSATLSISRKPQYFLGIRIHRAILAISWKLGAAYTDTQVMDEISLDPDMNEEAKVKIVNDRLSELAKEYPDCHFSTEYIKTEDSDGETEDEDDLQHLLWPSDRLAIAREVEGRLMKIYGNIVSMKKMMHYRRDILDVAKGILPYVDTEEGRNQQLAERCRKHWLNRAAATSRSIDYNGKYGLMDEKKPK